MSKFAIIGWHPQLEDLLYFMGEVGGEFRFSPVAGFVKLYSRKKALAIYKKIVGDHIPDSDSAISVVDWAEFSEDFQIVGISKEWLKEHNIYGE